MVVGLEESISSCTNGPDRESLGQACALVHLGELAIPNWVTCEPVVRNSAKQSAKSCEQHNPPPLTSSQS